MAERTQREDSKHPIDKEKERYIRLVQVGLAICLAILPAICLADMCGLRQIVMILPLPQLMVGVVIMAIGVDGWQRLKERRRAEKTKLPDDPK